MPVRRSITLQIGIISLLYSILKIYELRNSNKIGNFVLHTLACESMKFAALVIMTTEDKEDGSISVDPLALAATSMDHVSQLSGLLKWGLCRFIK